MIRGSETVADASVWDAIADVVTVPDAIVVPEVIVVPDVLTTIDPVTATDQVTADTGVLTASVAVSNAAAIRAMRFS